MLYKKRSKLETLRCFLIDTLLINERTSSYQITGTVQRRDYGANKNIVHNIWLRVQSTCKDDFNNRKYAIFVESLTINEGFGHPELAFCSVVTERSGRSAMMILSQREAALVNNGRYDGSVTVEMSRVMSKLPAGMETGAGATGAGAVGAGATGAGAVGAGAVGAGATGAGAVGAGATGAGAVGAGATGAGAVGAGATGAIG